MRSLILLLIVCVFFKTNSIAQEEKEEVFQQQTFFGFKAGVNLGKLQRVSDLSDSSEPRTGFYLGSFIEFIKSKNFSIQPEITYSSTPNLVDDNVGFLHIPVLFKYKIGDRLAFYAGPETQFLLSISSTDIRDNSYKKFILAFDIGGELVVSNNFKLEVRYNPAISKFIDSGHHQYTKFHFLQIGLAYKIDN